MLLGIVVDIGIGRPFRVADEQAAIAGDIGRADHARGAEMGGGGGEDGADCCADAAASLRPALVKLSLSAEAGKAIWQPAAGRAGGAAWARAGMARALAAASIDNRIRIVSFLPRSPAARSSSSARRGQWRLAKPGAWDYRAAADPAAATKQGSLPTMRLLAPAVAALFALAPAAAMSALPVGSPAPDFTTGGALAGQPFQLHLREQLRHGPVVLYFYPALLHPGLHARGARLLRGRGRFPPRRRPRDRHVGRRLRSARAASRSRAAATPSRSRPRPPTRSTPMTCGCATACR